MDKSELRRDPLTREWTIFNEARALPPQYGSTLGEQLPESPFRAGLERYAAHTLLEDRTAHGWQVRVVPNRLPIVRVEGDHQPNGDGFLEHLDGVGAHEIVIEDPGDCKFEDLSAEDSTRVVLAWRSRIEDLMRDMRLRTFTIVKNHGRAAGQGVNHSISQLIALAIVPPTLLSKLEIARAYYVERRRSIFADVLDSELRKATRVVFENAGFVAFCPYAARGPFEVTIWPRRQSADFHHLNSEEAAQLAEAIQTSVRRINGALDFPAYHLALTTAPSRVIAPHEWPTLDEDFRWHVTITPRLQPTGSFESSTGCHVNGVWPEVAADHLRKEEARA